MKNKKLIYLIANSLRVTLKTQNAVVLLHKTKVKKESTNKT